MFQILTIIKKEFLQLKRNPLMGRMIFIAPIVQMVIFGYAITLDMKYTPTVVCDHDKSVISRDIISEMTNSNYFTVVAYVDRISELDEYLDKGIAFVSIYFPKRFSERINNGEPAQLPAYFDGSDSNNSTIAQSYLASILQKKMFELVESRIKALNFTKGSVMLVQPEIRVWYNEEMKSSIFMVPGVIGSILLIMTLMFTAMSVVREKEAGTIEQILVTPVRAYQFILGKIIPFVFIGYIDIAIVVSIGKYWFEVPSIGSIPLLFGLSFFFILTMLGIGIFVSTITKNQQQAMMTSFFFTVPNFVLSGFIFPIENMPDIIQNVTYIVPLRYYLVIIRGILLKGTGLEVLWDEALILFIFGLTIFSLSVFKFKKQLD